KPSKAIQTKKNPTPTKIYSAFLNFFLEGVTFPAVLGPWFDFVLLLIFVELYFLKLLYLAKSILLRNLSLDVDPFLLLELFVMPTLYLIENLTLINTLIYLN
ncbi:MAG TPA: hypothetical protein PLE98_01250, partial [Candidatus Dojkabacteria bacterium]|nr:hypothetical protein [Candidatus Dojkabacteria bacterium]